MKNEVEHFLYKRVAKPLFFRFDPEKVHNLVSGFGVVLGSNGLTRLITRMLFSYSHPRLRQELAGIMFENPVGLGAGFDKNARLTKIMPNVGFGWMEVGTITARPCAGNPKPRVHRLPDSKSLLVNYGLMNDGVDAIYDRLQNSRFSIPIGTSLAPTNDGETADYKKAIDEYVYSYKKMSAIGSYTTLNLSCPNTCNDQPFMEAGALDELLKEIRKVPTKKPLFLKLSPDRSLEGIDELLAVAKKHAVAGVICSNLTKLRKNPAIKDANVPEKGGMSGKVVEDRADAMIAHIAKTWGKTFIIVGLGGVFTAEDAYRKIRLGADLIQLVTGMIYEGPSVISQINQGLVRLMKEDGFESISQVVGKDVVYIK